MAEVLLPPNAAPFERAAEQSMALYGDRRPIVIDTLWDPARCPEALLPFLAWGLGVRRWDPDWPEATRRKVVAEAIATHRRRGTLGAVRTALDDIDAVYDLIERPGGAAHRIDVRIYNSNTLLGTTPVAVVREYIEDAKRLSVHYTLTLAASIEAIDVAVLAGVATPIAMPHLALRIDVPTPPVALEDVPVGVLAGARPVTVADVALRIG